MTKTPGQTDIEITSCKIPFKHKDGKTLITLAGVEWMGAKVKRVARGERELTLLLTGQETALRYLVDPLDALKDVKQRIKGWNKEKEKQEA